MRVSYRWLQDYVDVDIDAHELAKRLTAVGLTVEGVASIGEGLEGIRVGRIVESSPHPDAELRICRVDVGGSGIHTILSGATNVQTGDLVPVALPGTRLPGGHLVQVVDMKGIRSEGVMLSESEVGVGTDHTGIWILPREAGLGSDLADALGLRDQVIEIEAYNRADCLGMIGVAREVAALLGRSLQLPPTPLVESGERIEERIQVRIDDPGLCSRYTARRIQGVRVAPSVLWMQARLRAAGMRPINNLVDVTNFVMLEIGQPLHAFDANRLREGLIQVRLAGEGERIRTLDGEDRELRPDMLVIADAAGAVAIAGVMGGLETEVMDKTNDVLLESAAFRGASVRRTSRALGLRSEASMRFEKGVSSEGVAWASNRAASLMQQLAGGTVAPGMVDAYPAPSKPVVVHLRSGRVNRILGTQIKFEEMKAMLERLHFDVTPAGDVIQVAVPYFRQDVDSEIDLAEEIARMHGYDNIAATIPGGSPRGQKSERMRLQDRTKDLLVGCGLRECITYSFISPKSYDRLRLPPEDVRRRLIRLRNPLAEDLSVLRTTLVPGVLETLARNAHRQQDDAFLFELGAVYLPDELPLHRLPVEPLRCAIALMGSASGRNWHERRRDADFFDLKGVVEGLLEGLRLQGTFVAETQPFLHPGRAAAILVDGRRLGWLGELHPEVLSAYDLPRRVQVAELDMEAVLSATPGVTEYAAIGRHPAVVRDLALLSPKEWTGAEIAAVIQEVGGPVVRDTSLFDVYEGDRIPPDKRSLAYSITYQAEGRTLTDDEVGAVEGRIRTALQERMQISVRDK